MSVEAEIDFSLKFLMMLNPNEKPTIFSPASLLNALAMIYAGTDEITAKQLEKVIGGENLSATEILKYYSNFGKFCKSTTSDNDLNYKLLFSNKLFLSKVPLLPSFEKCMSDFFENSFEQVDFSKITETVKKINNFVNEKTEGLIESIVTENDVDSLINIFIVNALCFIGEWEERFDDPVMGNFYANSMIKEIEMISLYHPLSEYNFKKGENWKCLGIPYKTRNSWLHILLPNSRNGLPQLLKQLNNTFIKKCIENNLVRHVSVTIPAFHIENEINLKEKMELFGLTQLFSDHGLTKIFQSRHFIDKAIHKAGIKLDENGTFGYAAAAASGIPQAAFEIQEFVADHPFIYFVTFVKDQNPQNLKSILLMGTFC